MQNMELCFLLSILKLTLHLKHLLVKIKKLVALCAQMKNRILDSRKNKLKHRRKLRSSKSLTQRVVRITANCNPKSKLFTCVGICKDRKGINSVSPKNYIRICYVTLTTSAPCAIKQIMCAFALVVLEIINALPNFIRNVSWILLNQLSSRAAKIGKTLHIISILFLATIHVSTLTSPSLTKLNFQCIVAQWMKMELPPWLKTTLGTIIEM